MDNRQKGEIARLKVMLRAAELDAGVSVPMTEVRYDCILDWHGRLYRAQVKYADAHTGRGVGAVFLNLSKGDKFKKLYQDNEIDALLVYLPKTDKVYWFGPEVFHGKRGLYIRYEVARNGQKKNVLLAEDHVW